jgi:hypothetical protein
MVTVMYSMVLLVILVAVAVAAIRDGALADTAANSELK